MKPFWNVTFHAIFWLWNLIFIYIVYAAIVPFVGLPLVQATFRGEIPAEFCLSFLILITVPAVCCAIGGWKFSRHPSQLIGLFYGVEAPLFILCLLRLFIIRELTAASMQIIVTFGICMAAYFLELFLGSLKNRNVILQWLSAIAYGLMILCGIYTSVLLLFYALPVLAYFVTGLLSFISSGDIFRIVTYGLSAFLFFIFFILSGSLFIAMPIVLAWLYVRSGVRYFRSFISRQVRTRITAVASAALVAWIAIFFALQQQPQVRAFALLDKPVSSDRDRQTLLSQSDTIRAGLVNAYLAPYRYLSSKEGNNHIRDLFKGAYNTPDWLGKQLQNYHDFLMSPFLYDGSYEKDPDKAEKLYASFFDTSIQKVERQAISYAVRSTFNEQEVQAGLLNINEQKVWLRSQDVTVTEHNDWAEVELYEVYENQTYEPQEVFYSFSLPESAVITGLWLGDTSDRANRFPFVVSPRGAAQKVYKSQVRKSRPQDPALLEQVGSRHYRLRAFPIPAKQSILAGETAEGPTEMHLWLTYKVLRQEKGWLLPDLGEKRNIFWTNFTNRTRNGKKAKIEGDVWLESFLSATGKFQPTAHRINLPDKYTISAQPLSDRDYVLPKGKRFAVVLDSSRSMGSHVEELSQTWSWLEKHGFADRDLANNDVDLFVSNSQETAVRRIDDIQQYEAEKSVFFGTIQPKEMLAQFETLRGDTVYDGVILLSDEGSYDLAKNSKTVPAISVPLWIVHLGELPGAYDDGLIKAIQDSGGGISQNLQEVLQRIATKEALGKTVVSVVDGYAWRLEETPEPIAEATADDFLSLAARQLILGLSKTISLDNLDSLDAIHAIAKRYKLVSPYSSMLVLVNDEQRELLKQAEAERDRFDRKVENGKEALTKPHNPLKTSVGVPEPSNGWGLIVGAIVFVLFARRKNLFRSQESGVRRR